MPKIWIKPTELPCFYSYKCLVIMFCTCHRRSQNWSLKHQRTRIWHFRKRKTGDFRLEGHVTLPPPPPPQSHFRGQGIRCMIWALCHWKTPPDCHLNSLCNSNYASRCKFAHVYTWSKIPSFESSVTWMIIQIAHFALVWKHWYPFHAEELHCRAPLKRTWIALTPSMNRNETVINF